ncbi:hypothetical protein SGLAM104S_09796 [Streptomyces glaucescens]
MFGEGRGGGEAGGADAADGDVSLAGVGADPVVLVPGGGAQPGVDGGDLLVEQGGQDPAALLAQVGETVGGGAGGPLVVQVLGGGAEQDVAVDGGGDQDALAEGGGDGQQDVPDQGAGELVVDEELAAARGDGEVVVTELPVEGVGVQSGRVDEPVGAQGAPGGGQLVDAVPPGGLLDAALEVQVDAVADGLGGVGEGGGPGADDGLAGDVQGAERARSEVRFARVQFGRAEQAGVVAVVAYGLPGEPGQGGELFLVPGDEEGADPFDGDARSAA